MKQITILILLPVLLLCGLGAGAQRTGVRDEVRGDWNKSSGLDCVYDFSEKAATPAPKGYEAFYISHYGRHGSRYAYTAKAYTVPLEMMKEGAAKGNLTPYGEELFANLEAFWKAHEHEVGDLTPLGWEQHQRIPEQMVKAFPKVFGKGSRIDACSSAAVRSIMSMASEVSAFSRIAPKAQIFAHQGVLDIQATRPNLGPNPFRYKGPTLAFPYGESSANFFLRRMPHYKDVLARLFKDPDAALVARNPYDVFFNLYMLVGGMNSLPEEVRFDVKGIFSVEEFATMWEVDNYERFREYLKYRTSCSSIIDDVVAKADARLATLERGADLRFGHDHVVMALLMILDLDDFARVPEDPDELVYWFQTFRSPMAANIQLVFYAPKKAGKDVLVKVLLNGEEARLGALPAEQGPYYRWPAVRDYLNQRTGLFVTR
ncbi:MAG: hypothetical protein IKX37_06755 [Bacteroidales bacterium]|nr:hypothetical protein [Bacteroidales bacterium]